MPPTTDVTTRTSKPCEGGTPPMSAAEVETQLHDVPGWALVDGRLERAYPFRNYYETMAFVNVVAWVANREGHHPVLEVGVRQCRVSYWTRAIDGLSENDFICAAKLNQLVG